MNTRKKAKSNIEAVAAKQPEYIETWKGSLPTKPWPIDKRQAQSESDDEEGVEWQYNPSRGIWFQDCQKPMKITKTSDPSKSVVDLYDSTDDESTPNEQTAQNENSRAVIQSKSTMFSSNKQVSTQPSLEPLKKKSTP